MDPNATLEVFTKAVLEEDAEEAREAYENLRSWLERGGFEPAWGSGFKCNRKQFFSFNPRTGMLE